MARLGRTQPRHPTIFAWPKIQVFTPAPTVTGVSPTSGGAAGGTSVTITGTNFTGATAVAFGGNAATFSVVNATTITATSPAGTGVADITVTTPGGTSATSAADQFTYLALPTISTISPQSGPITGGTTVTITGTNLTGASQVLFGGIAATSYSVINSTTITAVSPAEQAGAVDVRVTTPGGTTATSMFDVFTYSARTPALFGLLDRGGPPADAYRTYTKVIGGVRYSAIYGYVINGGSQGEVQWALLQPDQTMSTLRYPGAVRLLASSNPVNGNGTPNVIDRAIADLFAWNTNTGVWGPSSAYPSGRNPYLMQHSGKLRVAGGRFAPDWAKCLGASSNYPTTKTTYQGTWVAGNAYALDDAVSFTITGWDPSGGKWTLAAGFICTSAITAGSAAAKKAPWNLASNTVNGAQAAIGIGWGAGSLVLNSVAGITGPGWFTVPDSRTKSQLGVQVFLFTGISGNTLTGVQNVTPQCNLATTDANYLAPAAFTNGEVVSSAGINTTNWSQVSYHSYDPTQGTNSQLPRNWTDEYRDAWDAFDLALVAAYDNDIPGQGHEIGQVNPSRMSTFYNEPLLRQIASKWSMSQTLWAGFVANAKNPAPGWDGTVAGTDQYMQLYDIKSRTHWKNKRIGVDVNPYQIITGTVANPVGTTDEAFTRELIRYAIYGNGATPGTGKAAQPTFAGFATQASGENNSLRYSLETGGDYGDMYAVLGQDGTLNGIQTATHDKILTGWTGGTTAGYKQVITFAFSTVNAGHLETPSGYDANIAATDPVSTAAPLSPSDCADLNSIAPTLGDPVVTPVAPSAPTSVTASIAAGSTTATVSWAIGSTGGAALTQVQITPRSGVAPDGTGGIPQPSLAVNAASPATTPNSKTVPGLSFGVAYNFDVVATNPIGSSPAGSMQTTLTPRVLQTLPAKVTPPPNVDTGNGFLHVSWTAPDPGTGTIDSYRLTPYQLVSATDLVGTALTPIVVQASVAGVPPPTSYDVTELQNGVFYDFTVEAHSTVTVGGTNYGPASDRSTPAQPAAQLFLDTMPLPDAAHNPANWTPRLFGGFLMQPEYRVTSGPERRLQVKAQDYTLRTKTTVANKQYGPDTSHPLGWWDQDIIRDLFLTYRPDVDLTYIAAVIGPLPVVSFPVSLLSSAMAKIIKLSAAYFRVDYYRRLYYGPLGWQGGPVNISDAPSALTTPPSIGAEGVVYAPDASALVNRLWVVGGKTQQPVAQYTIPLSLVTQTQAPAVYAIPGIISGDTATVVTVNGQDQGQIGTLGTDGALNNPAAWTQNVMISADPPLVAFKVPPPAGATITVTAVFLYPMIQIVERSDLIALAGNVFEGILRDTRLRDADTAIQLGQTHLQLQGTAKGLGQAKVYQYESGGVILQPGQTILLTNKALFAGGVLSRPNLLDANQASLEGSIDTGWVAPASTNVTQSALGPALDGTASLKITATVAGDAVAMSAGPGGAGATHTPALAAANTPYSFLASLRADTAGRTVELWATFLNPGDGSVLQTTRVAVGTDVTTGFTSLSGMATSPSTQTFVQLEIHILGCGLGEAHYADCMGIFAGYVTTWGLYKGNSITLPIIVNSLTMRLIASLEKFEVDIRFSDRPDLGDDDLWAQLASEQDRINNAIESGDVGTTLVQSFS